MIHHPEMLQELRRLADPSITTALGEAIEAATPAERTLLVPELLQRKASPAHASILRIFHQLDDESRVEVTRQTAQLTRGIRDISTSGDAQTMANLLAVIESSRDLSLAYLLLDMLKGRNPQIADSAALVLVRFASELAGRRDLPWCPAQHSARIRLFLEAIAPATVTQEPAISACAQSLLWLLPLTLKHLPAGPGDRKSPMVEAVASILEDPNHPVAPRAILPMLATEHWRSPALSGLHRLARRNRHHLVEPQSHYLLSPRVMKGFGEVREPRQLLPERWPIQATVATVRWVARLPLEPEVKLERLLQLRKHPLVEVRRAGLSAAMEVAARCAEAPAPSCFEPWLGDSEPGLAMMACLWMLDRAKADPSALLPRLLACTHEPVRKLAGRRLGLEAFEKLWTHWPDLSVSQRHTLAKALRKLGLDYQPMLERRLRLAHPATLIRAVQFVALLGIGDTVESRLLVLLQHPDPVVVASAVRALGEVRSQRALIACEMAMDHPDGRVRANSIEALERLESRRHAHRLMRMAARESNRAQANAIKALMAIEPAHAIAALARMLADSRPAYRNSALWLVEAMQLQKLSSLISEIARADPEPPLRQRARKVASMLHETFSPVPANAQEPPNHAA